MMGAAECPTGFCRACAGEGEATVSPHRRPMLDTGLGCLSFRRGEEEANSQIKSGGRVLDGPNEVAGTY